MQTRLIRGLAVLALVLGGIALAATASPVATTQAAGLRLATLQGYLVSAPASTTAPVQSHRADAVSRCRPGRRLNDHAHRSALWRDVWPRWTERQRRAAGQRPRRLVPTLSQPHRCAT